MIHVTPFFTIYCMVLAFVVGTILASFLGCFGWRICHGESVLKGRSHCDSCGHVLGAHDLIPILSYLFAKGRCRYCGTSISKFNVYGELFMGVIFAIITYFAEDVWQLFGQLFFVCILYLVSATDIYEQIIPDRVLVTAALVRVVYVSIENQYGLSETPLWSALLRLLVDGLALSLPLLLLVLLMEHIWKKEAMGGGDIKLIFITGLYLGWMNNFMVLFFACIVGIIVGTIQQKNRQKNRIVEEGQEEEEGFYFPFGPSIAISAVFVMLFGKGILDWYLSLF